MSYLNFIYSEKEWFYMRLSMAISWVCFAFPSLWFASELTVPVGFASYVPLDVFLLLPVKILVLLIASYFLLQYVYREQKRWATLVLSVISLLIFTMEESSGVFSRVSLLTMVWVVQFLAFVLFSKQKEGLHNRVIHFSIQMIVVAYSLSAYSKWSSSGWHWVLDGQNLDLQILKGFYFQWADHGDVYHLQNGKVMMHIVHENQWFINLVLWFSLFLESSVFLMLWNRKVTRIFGFLLICMHLGIYVIMGGILILPVFIPMLIFTLNPVYAATKTWTKLTHLIGVK